MVGFADTSIPEQKFQLVVDKKDLGFNLKSFGEKGYGLFNLQTLALTMAGESTSNEVAKAVAATRQQPEPISFEKKATSPATDVTKEPQPGTIEAPSKTEAPPVGVNEGLKTNPGDKASSTSSNPPAINKFSEEVDSSGLKLSYADKGGKKTDTIYVVIPSSTATGVSTTTTKPIASAPADGSTTVQMVIPGNTQQYNCDPASDEDFLKLRKKMASVSGDDKMIAQAAKAYKEKCFTTTQIRLLSTLFLSDEGRYRFFDASYSHVADAANFSSLQREFIDPYYLNRFKAMLR